MPPKKGSTRKNGEGSSRNPNGFDRDKSERLAQLEKKDERRRRRKDKKEKKRVGAREFH